MKLDEADFNLIGETANYSQNFIILLISMYRYKLDQSFYSSVFCYQKKSRTMVRNCIIVNPEWACRKMFFLDFENSQ